MLNPSGVRRLGRYVLFDEIASGGMATVHLGRLLGEAGFARTVAIKRLHPHYARAPEFVAMFVDEARLAARIRHPNVVSTLDVVAEGGELFLVMEYVQGESLSRLFRAAVKRGGPVPVRIAVSMIAGALYGLHAAHEAKTERGEPLGLVHRDVSPQNVIVDIDGVARVLDFGIAKAAWRIQTTREGQLKGKLAYMAPEQIAERTSDRRSDVYAISVVLWELLTGRRFVDTENIAAAATRIVEEPAEAPSGLTPALPSAIDQAVLKGLERDPAARFQTAKEMAMALEQAALPLTNREVGEWVADIAGEALARRAALVEAIETHEGVLTPPPSSHSGPIPHADGGGGHAGEAPTLVSIVGPIEALAARAARQAAGEDQITDQITELSVTTGGGAQAPPRWGLLLACAVGALSAVLVVGAVALYWLPRRGPAARVVEGDVAPAAATETPEADVTASAAPIATAPAIASASASAAPVASPRRSGTSTASARPAAAAATRPAARPGVAPKVDCNPPFFVSKDGTKQYKPECL